MNIKNLLQSGEVVRYHCHTGIPKQPNSAHQWGVALVVQYIHPHASKELILAALTHDAAEYYTGDMPAPLKWHSHEIKSTMECIEAAWEETNGLTWLSELSDFEKSVLHWADAAEGMWYCIQQIKLGNGSAGRPFRKWKSLLQNMPSPTQACEQMFTMLLSEEEKWNARK